MGEVITPSGAYQTTEIFWGTLKRKACPMAASTCPIIKYMKLWLQRVLTQRAPNVATFATKT